MIMYRSKNLIRKLFPCIALALCTAACDTGDIYPEEVVPEKTLTVNGSFVFTNTSTIPQQRERRLALVALDSETALKPIRMSRILEAKEGKATELQLDKVQLEAKAIALVITDQSSEIISTLYTFKIDDSTEKETIELGTVAIDLAMYSRVQNQLFDQSCLSCHNEVKASKKLRLDKDVSYAQTVNKPSVTHPERLLVMPKYASQSYLVSKLLEYDGNGFNHMNLTTLKEEDIELLKAWIKSGAKK